MVQPTSGNASDLRPDLQPQALAVLDQMTDAVVLLDQDGRVIYANLAAVRMNKLALAELLGQTYSDLWPGAVSAIIEQTDRQAAQTPCELFYEPLMLWLEIQAYLVEAGQGVCFRDISARKQAEEALRQKNAILEAINESAPTPIFVKDRKGRIIYANPATLAVLGKSAAEVIGQRDCDLYASSELGAEVTANDQRIMASGQTEVVEESPDGLRTFLGMKAPYRNAAGEVIGLIGIANDISDRVQFERDRDRILQQEQMAREAAERANRLKDEFLAVLSHELRSPLAPILGWVKLLQSGRLDPAKTAEALDTIERNARLQSQLIEDLLDISRIMQGKLSLVLAPVNLAQVILAAIETVRLAAETKAIQITTDFAPTVSPVYGDASRLQQVVWNLLSNAIKFTPEGRQVEIHLTQVNDHARMQVIDPGKGISSEFLPHVFEHFRQADGATTRQFGGLGLGLAIARQIVELHEGRIWAESAGEDQGATFTVELLVQAALAEDVAGADSIQSDALPLADLRVLVVDDHLDSREFVTFVVEHAGAKVTAVSSAIAALQLLSTATFDLLLSDIGMPEMDGYALIRQMRQLPGEQGKIPAIALTAYAGEIDQQQALAAGFQQHLAKPVNLEQIVEAVTRCIQSKYSSAV